MKTSYQKQKINKIIISNGHFNFFLGELAQNLERDNRLDRFIMSGYPGAGFIKFLTKIKFNKDVLYRLSSRRKNISDKLVISLWFTEFLIQTAQKIRNIKVFSQVTEFLDILSLRIYSLSAMKCIKNSDAKYYHYRSGYGLESAKLAKKKGMVLVCDHSIAHPHTVDYLIAYYYTTSEFKERLVSTSKEHYRIALRTASEIVLENNTKPFGSYYFHRVTSPFHQLKDTHICH